jgi:hypothetical protein
MGPKTSGENVTAEEIIAAAEGVFPYELLPAGLPANRFPARGVLRLDSVTGLSLPQFNAVSDGAKAAGDRVFYLSFRERRLGLEPQDFIIQAGDYSRYETLLRPSASPHILVSPRAAWGVFVLNEGIAVLAGDQAFLDVVFRSLPSSEDQLTHFARDVAATKHDGLNEWLLQLYSGLFGAAEVVRILGAREIPAS